MRERIHAPAKGFTHQQRDSRTSKGIHAPAKGFTHQQRDSRTSPAPFDSASAPIRRPGDSFHQYREKLHKIRPPHDYHPVAGLAIVRALLLKSSNWGGSGIPLAMH